MKNKLMQILILLALFGTEFGFAQGKDIKVDVNGMVCAFCSQGITKNFKAHSAVEDVKVDMANKVVSLKIKDNAQITDDEITKLIKDSGVSVGKITR